MAVRRPQVTKEELLSILNLNVPEDRHETRLPQECMRAQNKVSSTVSR